MNLVSGLAIQISAKENARYAAHLCASYLPPIKKHKLKKQKGDLMMNDKNNIDKNTVAAVQALVDTCHGAAVFSGWWYNLSTMEDMRGQRNMGEMLMLIVSEVAEAMEADRKGLMDEKLPDRSGLEVELADAVIRICDLAGGFDLDLAGAVAAKLEYNRKRADHKIENRKMAGGKKY